MGKAHTYVFFTTNQIEIKPSPLTSILANKHKTIRFLHSQPITGHCCVFSRANPCTTYLSTYPGFVLAGLERPQLEEWNELLIFRITESVSALKEIPSEIDARKRYAAC